MSTLCDLRAQALCHRLRPRPGQSEFLNRFGFGCGLGDANDLSDEALAFPCGRSLRHPVTADQPTRPVSPLPMAARFQRPGKELRSRNYSFRQDNCRQIENQERRRESFRDSNETICAHDLRRQQRSRSQKRRAEVPVHRSRFGVYLSQRLWRLDADFAFAWLNR